MIHYTGYRPTVHYVGLVWFGLAALGVEVAPGAVGFVIFSLWIGWMQNEK